MWSIDRISANHRTHKFTQLSGFVCKDLIKISPSIQHANDFSDLVVYAIEDDKRTGCH